MSLDLSSVRSLTNALDRTPNGTAVVELGRKLGLWSTAAHANPEDRKPFIASLGTISERQLSDEMGYWTSEFGRLAELNGVLVGQRNELGIRGKKLRATAKSKIRKECVREDRKAPTQGELNDLAEEDVEVLENDERLVLVETMVAFVQAAKEATAQYLQTLSREIAYRDAQMKARLYG
jgi:hypothetical protein